MWTAAFAIGATVLLRRDTRRTWKVSSDGGCEGQKPGMKPRRGRSRGQWLSSRSCSRP